MKKIILFLLMGIILLLTACESDNGTDDKTYKYDLTSDNLLDYIEFRVEQIEIEYNFLILFEVSLNFEIDEEDSDVNLLLILFEIDIDIVLSFEYDDNIYYLEDNLKLGSGAQTKGQFIKLERQLLFEDFQLEDVTIIFDHIVINEVEGHIILKNPID